MYMYINTHIHIYIIFFSLSNLFLLIFSSILVSGIHIRGNPWLSAYVQEWGTKKFIASSKHVDKSHI